MENLDNIKANKDNDLKIRNTINKDEDKLTESVNDAEDLEYFTE